MPLQIDATIQYALERPKENLSLADLEVDSPYNTYQNEGLPPGPICSPEPRVPRGGPEPRPDKLPLLRPQGRRREHFFTNDYDDFLRAKAEAGR